MHFFPYVTNTQAYQKKLENWKNESLVGLTPEHKKVSLAKLYLENEVHQSTQKMTKIKVLEKNNSKENIRICRSLVPCYRMFKCQFNR